MCCPDVGEEEGRDQDEWKRKYVIDGKESAGRLKKDVYKAYLQADPRLATELTGGCRCKQSK